MYSFSIRQFIWEYIGVFSEKFWSAKKSTRLKWSISLLNPFKKCQKNNRAKGVALKSPDIKIIMYVCTPLNKVFRFQGSKILVVEIVSQFPFLFETLSQTLSEALKTL